LINICPLTPFHQKLYLKPTNKFGENYEKKKNVKTGFSQIIQTWNENSISQPRPSQHARRNQALTNVLHAPNWHLIAR